MVGGAITNLFFLAYLVEYAHKHLFRVAVSEGPIIASRDDPTRYYDTPGTYCCDCTLYRHTVSALCPEMRTNRPFHFHPTIRHLACKSGG
jgi:hypothetical protein